MSDLSRIFHLTILRVVSRTDVRPPMQHTLVQMTKLWSVSRLLGGLVVRLLEQTMARVLLRWRRGGREYLKQ